MHERNATPAANGRKGRSAPGVLVAVAALLVAILAASSCGASGSGGQPGGQAGGSSGGQGASTTEERPLGHPALGDANAPVVLIEYGDYQ